ncbi:MAG: energy-coupling factor transporter transmembrane protein EcfT [Coriobacteriia bacterium]|nr:energy-coupling factor transporter transmembrane protein EcfT [Coriobacteriia bacterium]
MELPKTVWETAFILALTLFILAIAVVIVIHRLPKRTSIIRPLPLIIAATFIAMLILCLPAYFTRVGTENGGILESLLLSIQMSLKIFKLDNPYDLFLSPLSRIDSWVTGPYMIFSTALCILAPFLSVSFILSFIKGLTAYISYFLGYYREAYIFSKLNEESFTLAQSVLAHHEKERKGAPGNPAPPGKKSRPLIVFTDVHVENNKPPQKLYQSARDLKCICFKRDIQSVRFDIHAKSARMRFIIIGDDQQEKNGQALRILGKAPAKEKPDYSSRDPKKTTLYIFDSSKESELLLDGKQGAMAVRRINSARQFAHYFLWDYLWDEATEKHVLFDSAREVDGQKAISVLLVGLGRTGVALLKTLSWYCQMDGYRLSIHALDTDPNSEKRLRFECPDLLNEEYNNNADPDEAVYSITVHPGIDVLSKDFADLVSSIAADITFTFISLGDDELNVETAANLRMLFTRAGHNETGKPLIYSVVHDPKRATMLKSLANYSNDDYQLRLIGDIRDLFSYQMVFDPRLENLAEQAHIQWSLTDEAERTEERIEELSSGFWGKEYYRNSSIARIMHEKAVDSYGPTSADALAKLESRRWNAYMRSEGFVYSDKRNNLAKQHHLLIPYSKKPKEEQAKDYRGFKK